MFKQRFLYCIQKLKCYPVPSLDLSLERSRQDTGTLLTQQLENHCDLCHVESSLKNEHICHLKAI